MAKAKKVETKERAAVGRERRLALALAAVADEAAEKNVALESVQAANELLSEMGYGQLESIQKRLNRINEELTAAVAAGDGAKIAELGKELQKAQSGKFHRESVKADAATTSA